MLETATDKARLARGKNAFSRAKCTRDMRKSEGAEAARRAPRSLKALKVGATVLFQREKEKERKGIQ